MSRWNEYIQALAKISDDDIKVVRFDGNQVIEMQNSFPNINNLKAAMLAQAILESGRGMSRVARECLNFHGLMWREEMKNIAEPEEVEVSSEADGKAVFCKFKTLEDEIKGYFQFIQRSPYPDVLKHTKNAQDYLGYIGPKYCPPGYTPLWIAEHGDKDYDDYICDNLLQEAKNALTTYDWAEDRVSHSNVVDQRLRWIPWAKDYTPIPTSWKYPDGYPEGAIIHFTAGSSIESSLDWLRKMGFPCLGIGRDGTLYQSFPINEGGPHCGTWHHRNYVGIEIAAAGKCKPIGNKKYQTWWGGILDESRIRHSSGNENIQEGYYEAFTAEQESTLELLLLWLKANHPTIFKLENILGHDEIAPHRKNDPGAALSRTMAEYRTYIQQRYKEVYGDAILSVHYHSWTDEIRIEDKHIKHTTTKYEYDNPLSATPSEVIQSVIADAALSDQQWENLKNFIRNCGFEKLDNSYGAPENERYYPYTLTINWGTEKKEVRYRSNPSYGEPPEVFNDVEKHLFNLSKEVQN